MTGPDPRHVQRADVLIGDQLAAHLSRVDNTVEFRYTDSYLDAGGESVATTLPLSEEPVPAVRYPPTSPACCRRDAV